MKLAQAWASASSHTKSMSFVDQGRKDRSSLVFLKFNITTFWKLIETLTANATNGRCASHHSSYCYSIECRMMILLLFVERIIYIWISYKLCCVLCCLPLLNYQIPHSSLISLSYSTLCFPRCVLCFFFSIHFNKRISLFWYKTQKRTVKCVLVVNRPYVAVWLWDAWREREGNTHIVFCVLDCVSVRFVQYFCVHCDNSLLGKK